jgi:hypothetical protein
MYMAMDMVMQRVSGLICVIWENTQIWIIRPRSFGKVVIGLMVK